MITESNNIKIFVKNGNKVQVSEGVFLELINMEYVVDFLKDISKQVPSPGFKVTLSYKLTVDNNEYLGEFTHNHYSGNESKMDEKSPYDVKFITWKFGDDNPDKYFEFDVIKK
ncbi:MAG: hypothetical protein FWG80_01230 [Alphaproteobacteria bacterium]|nr:hypothetical protein [Alphaproteobacteria bacterium]